MEEIMSDVLIKKCGDRLHDQVLIIENLPSRFLYEQTTKMVPRKDRDGYMDGTYVVDPSGEKTWTLYPGIERSQTGDGGYCFWVGNQESENRLKDIMRYIDKSLPRDQRIPTFVENAQVRGESNTGPLALSMIPRVSLPKEKTDSPALAPSLSPSATVNPQEPSGPIRRGGWTKERRAEMSARMKKQHEKRKAELVA